MALDTDRRPACGNCTHLLAEHRMGDAWSRCLTRGCDCEYDGERGGWLPTRYEVDRLRDALADLIDAARLFVDPATPHEATCYSREAAMRAPRECPCDCGLDDLRDALAALEADRG